MCVAVLMALVKFSGVENKLMAMQTIKMGSEHQHNNDINEQWETTGQRMTQDGIGSRLTYHEIVSSFARRKQHEKLNNGCP